MMDINMSYGFYSMHSCTISLILILTIIVILQCLFLEVSEKFQPKFLLQTITVKPEKAF